MVSSLTDIDGNAYPVVAICNQFWTAKNLNVSHYQNGDTISEVRDSTAWLNLTTGAWCWYNNDSNTYGGIYGKMYNWYAINDPRGIAPVGWHVPSDSEWTALELCSGGMSTCGWNLKDTGLTLWRPSYPWLDSNVHATNITGFTALPGGWRDLGRFGGLNTHGYWWCSNDSNPSANSSGAVYCRRLTSENGSSIVTNSTKRTGYSVRLIKD